MTGHQQSYREQVKQACLDFAAEQDLDPGEMSALFKYAAEFVRTQKTASVSDWLKNYVPAPLHLAGHPVTWGILGGAAASPLVMGLAAQTGYHGGQQVQKLQQGRVPSAKELHDVDETMQFLRQAREIEKRIARNKRRREEMKVPSNRKMF